MGTMPFDWLHGVLGTAVAVISYFIVREFKGRDDASEKMLGALKEITTQLGAHAVDIRSLYERNTSTDREILKLREWRESRTG